MSEYDFFTDKTFEILAFVDVAKERGVTLTFQEAAQIVNGINMTREISAVALSLQVIANSHVIENASLSADSKQALRSFVEL